MIANREIVSIPMSRIERLENSRASYDDGAMAELMVSMKQTGLLQPVGVAITKTGRGKDDYAARLIFGFRRFMAAEKLGWQEIDAVVVESKSDEDDLVKNGIENIHRVNVSLPEQGRIFSVLMKHGLTKSEVAARHGVKIEFVTAALEAFQHIPAAYQSRITHRQGARGEGKAGTIPASSAFRVLNLKKKYKLNNDQTEKLLEFTSHNNVSSEHMKVVGALLERNYSIQEAMEKADNTRILTLSFAVDKNHIAKLEKKYGVSVYDIAYTWLEQNEELKVYSMRTKQDQKTVVVTRKAKGENDERVSGQ